MTLADQRASLSQKFIVQNTPMPSKLYNTRPLRPISAAPIEPTEEFAKQLMSTGGMSRLAPGKAALERQTGLHNAILASSSLESSSDSTPYIPGKIPLIPSPQSLAVLVLLLGQRFICKVSIVYGNEGVLFGVKARIRSTGLASEDRVGSFCADVVVEGYAGLGESWL
jgi:hypothetical protein